ncbi:RluA family pseudouridine synthase [Methylacidiphilum caldifontis]|uniref:Pseudouridine synthase n=1 Tax=Methylacidiphilum caldifontis TaxID=2795386 RepID=A0A4Y8P7D5_9BACT|nr:RluA family pseudouridine synthase [Methylacidiphilum caldifontis]QSR88929.1 RluA family pseudouridine synthase [Methylacidiphilum caldifontis]TFE66223.1 RNA pseudouridine synthase [Methylacidiphilum caldifontis]
MDDVNSLSIPKAEIEKGVGKRIDLFLSSLLNVSRNKVKKKILSGALRLKNGSVLEPSHRIRGIEEIEILGGFNEEIAPLPKAEKIPLDVLFEDEDILVLNKKRGMVVHPSCGHWTGTIVNALIFRYGQLLPGSSLLRPGIVHRLDKDTSGVMVIAKTEEALKSLLLQFSQRTVHKVYICLCKNRFPYPYYTFESNINRHASDRKKMAVHQFKGKSSKTSFTVLFASDQASLLKCEPISGRTHQIRVHLSYLGFPIIGDPLYGKGVRKYPFALLLHAYALKFMHPRSGKRVEFVAPLPQDFQEAFQFFYGKNFSWKDCSFSL